MVAQALKITAPSASGNPASGSELRNTLQLFSELSQRLGESCHELESQVHQLQSELVESDRQRMKELTDKECLADRLAVILDVLPAAVITLNGNGYVDQANRAARELLGEPLDGEAWLDVIQRCFSPSPTDGHEIALKNGRLVSIATQSLGQEPGQIIVLNDLTETRRLQGQLSRHQKLSDMGRMTASLAHQIRTPLSTALLYTDHLLNPRLDSARKIRFAQKLKDRLLQLQSQVSDMLIFSRSGIMIQQRVDLRTLVDTAIHRHIDMVSRHGIVMNSDLDNAADSLLVCNLDLLVSAIGNLLDNAVQALSSQQIPAPRIQLDAHQQGQWITLRITDNGPGIPEASLHKITEPFFTTKSTGTGLGLAVVKAVATAHGAQLNVGNGAVKGAWFELVFPAKAAAASADVALQATQQPQEIAYVG